MENTVTEDAAYRDYMHARYYQAKCGRFLSVDPTWESADPGRPQTWNRYSYVTNNPINLTDPDGRNAAAAAGRAAWVFAADNLDRLQQLIVRPGALLSLAEQADTTPETEDGTEAVTDTAYTPVAMTNDGAIAVMTNGDVEINDWTGYPEGAPKPEGPFRIRSGEEYEQAREAANRANRTMHPGSRFEWQTHS